MHPEQPLVCKACVIADPKKHPGHDPVATQAYFCPSCGKHWSAGGVTIQGDVVAGYYPKEEKKKATKKDEK